MQKGNKSKSLNVNKLEHLKISIDISGDSLTSGVSEVTGRLDGYAFDTLWVVPTSELIEKKDRNDISKTINITYPSYNDQTIKIARDKIFLIKYKSKTSESLTNLAFFFSGIGELATLIVAPLISINYSNGNFNRHLYYSCALGGIAMAGISIPFFVFSKEKKISFRKRNKQGNAVWRFYENDGW